MTICYVYKIIFADGCWYWGVSKFKGKPPHLDGYYGSPVTHRDKWKEPHSKIVMKEFCSFEEGKVYEVLCIKPDFNNPRCLNENVGGAFSIETASKGGRAAARKFRGLPRTQEVKNKISNALKGRVFSDDHIQKLKSASRPAIKSESIAKRVASRSGYRHSDETKSKIGSANSGRPKTSEEKLKIAESIKGFVWYNNGIESIQSRQHPGEGWFKGRILDWHSPRTSGMSCYHKNGKNRMFYEDPGDGWVKGSLRSKGKRYYNNGSEHVLAFESPGEGWVLGRLKKS